MLRIGFGYDVHPLLEGYDLTLGGVKIPHDKGCAGHSDADALIHAICDALLGALALGDIGKHFPDTSQEYKGIDSRILLNEVMKLIKIQGYHIVNIDTTLCLEKPKINPHMAEMRNALTPILEIPDNCLSIKATTNEKMGFIGREEGVAAYAVVLLESRN